MPAQINKTPESKQNEREMLEVIGQCIEELCLRHSLKEWDNSKDKAGKKEEAADLLKLVQLLEQYIDLRDRVVPPQVSEAVAIDYALIKNYLEKRGAGDAS